MSTLAELAKHAAEIRKELGVPKQNELFATATEAGYLAARADGTIEEREHEAMVAAISALSVGAVIEWEVEELLKDCKKRFDAEGNDARATAVGKSLADLGSGEAGLLFAAFVAQSSAGIDKKESAVLHAIGKAAGIAKNKVTAILKRVGAAESE